MDLDELIVEFQMGRPPRKPWRVASRCAFDFPQVIVSPSLLEDGSRFPNWAYLTCPYLVQAANDSESVGATARWAQRAQEDVDLACELRNLDEAVKRVRCDESGGNDACSSVGLAGQKDPLGVKCVHAHVALHLAGLDDPIGREFLTTNPTHCDDMRCERRGVVDE